MAGKTWKYPGTSGDWNRAGNWNPSGIPASNENVTLGGAAAGYIVNISVAAAVCASLTIDAPTSGTTELAISSDSLTVTNGITLNANTEILSTGTSSITASTLTGAGIVDVASGTLTITAAIDGSGTATTFDIDSGGTLDLAATSAVGVGTSIDPTLTFAAAGTNETFQDTAATAGAVHLGTITGFAATDAIELKSYGANDSLTYDATNHTVTINGSETFTFSAGTDVAAIKLSDSGGVDTLTICFMAGTLIRTPGGEVAVETLKAGDLVLTMDGVAKPVSWLGKQTVSAVFADPVRSWPIRVKAGALADNVPARDLLLSPDHALLVEGVLINAGALVNGTSITRETTVPKVFVYYHVELDDHSLILAENTPAETFVDNVDRMNFDNWNEHQALYPEGKTIAELPYPRAKSRRQVPVAIRVLLVERAEAIGRGLDAAAVA